MNIKFLKSAIIGLTLACGSFANAGLIQSDYLTSNDNLTVTDTDNDLEWLNLTLTQRLTSTQATENFSEFRLATRAEYELLLTSHFSNFTSFDVNTAVLGQQNDNDFQLIEEFRELFGVTDEFVASFGWLVRPDSNFLQLAGVDGPNLYANSSLNKVNGAPNNPHETVGWFMVKAASSAVDVPEPTTLAIFAFGMLGLASRRFKK